MVVLSDAIKKKNICVFFFLFKHVFFLQKKNLASKKKTLKKCFFFKYSFKRNYYKLTVA